MGIRIETGAMRTFLLGILSCQCPVTLETERRLVDRFYTTAGHATMDFDGFVEIADTNPQRTPLHHLRDFCICATDDPLELTIRANDVLRYLGSQHHYAMVMSGHPDIASQNPGLLVSHLLVPVTLNMAGAQATATYRNPGARIAFAPVILPAGLTTDADAHALHMGVVLSALSPGQVQLLTVHQSLINGFLDITGKVDSVDFRNFPPYGDHYARVRERVGAYPDLCRR